MTQMRNQQPIAPAPEQQERQEAPPSPTTEHFIAALVAEFGARFDEEALARLREQVGQQIASAAALSAHRLTNADEPAFVFNPFMER